MKAHILFLISIVPLQLSFLYKNQGPHSPEKMTRKYEKLRFF